MPGIPSTTSKFAGKCKVCNVEIEKGSTIVKVNDHWCIDPNCGATAATSPTTPDQAPPNASPEAKAAFDKWHKDQGTQSKPTRKCLSEYSEEELKSEVQVRTKLLYTLNQTVTDWLKTQTADPHPGMVGQFTKIIYDDLTSRD